MFKRSSSDCVSAYQTSRKRWRGVSTDSKSAARSSGINRASARSYASFSASTSSTALPKRHLPIAAKRSPLRRISRRSASNGVLPNTFFASRRAPNAMSEVAASCMMAPLSLKTHVARACSAVFPNESAPFTSSSPPRSKTSRYGCACAPLQTAQWSADTRLRFAPADTSSRISDSNCSSGSSLKLSKYLTTALSASVNGGSSAILEI
mmetsp:Transcript_27/g.52  ORF Transcript_27/g.52 Transcript_27/m.52 type:complete len:208 (-) Transcript_27:182-805(-)